MGPGHAFGNRRLGPQGRVPEPVLVRSAYLPLPLLVPRSSLTTLYRLLGCGYSLANVLPYVLSVDSLVAWEDCVGVRNFHPCLDHPPECCVNPVSGRGGC